MKYSLQHSYNALLFVIILFIFPTKIDAQTTLSINKNGELGEVIHKAIIMKNGYQALSAFDTVSKSPLLIYAIYIKNNKFGIFDSYGKEITGPEYDAIVGLDISITANINGFLASYIVKQNKKYGLISNTGKVLLPIEYDRLHYSNKDSIFLAFKGQSQSYIDRNGKVLNYVKSKETSINDNYIPKYSNTLNQQKSIYTIKNNRKSNVLIVPNLGSISDIFQDRITFKSQDGKFGVYDGVKQKLIIPLNYDKIEISYPGHFIVSSGGKFGVIDSTGVIKLPIKYGAISKFAGGVLVYQDNKYALYNSNYKVLYDFIFDEYNYLGAQLGSLRKDGKYGLLEMPSGKTILDFDYEYIKVMDDHEFKNPIVIVSKDKKKGIGDLKINQFTPIVYDYLLPEARAKEDAFSLSEARFYSTNLPNLYYFFQKDGYYGLLDNDFKVIVNNEYDMIIKASRDYVAVNKGNKWGLLNVSTRKLTTGFEYDRKPEKKIENYFLIYKNNGYGLIDGDGKVIIPTIYKDGLRVSKLYNGLLDISSSIGGAIYADYYGNNVEIK